MSTRRRVFAALAAIVLVGCSGDDAADDRPPPPVVVERTDWSALFESAGVVGTFALRKVGSDDTQVYDVERAELPMLPASTFKILNTMVILQTGARSNVDEVLVWDGIDRGVEEWNQDHSLRSGIKVSAVWMFQEMARRVGDDAMADWVDRAEYGNRDIGGGIDEFWLRGDLRISALGQLDFLERLVTGALPFDDDVMSQAREIIVREEGDDWSWSYKSGTALAAEPTLGWLVGIAERADDDWVFALNIDLPGVEGTEDLQLQADRRVELARSLLEAEGALPSNTDL
jgi:beta-lactamase class D